MSNLDLIRPDLKTGKCYVAYGDNMTHRLHLNELPWSPLTSNVNRYSCEKREHILQAALADIYQVLPTQVLLLRGSEEGIDILMRLFLQPGVDSIMQFSPTYYAYNFFARMQLANVIDCPLNDNDGFSLPSMQIEENWRPGCKLIMLCRPNNPTGTSIDLSTIASLCEQFKKRSMIIVDEAYIEFSGDTSAASLIQQYDNLVVLRTLSKAYGLAGLRLGAVITKAPLIELMQNILPPYRISSPAIEMAIQALSNCDWFKTSTEQVILSRTMMIDALQRFSFIKVYPSATNFLFIKTVYAEKLFQIFSDQDIAVRRFPSSPKLQNYLRITLGDKTQNALLLKAISSMTEEI
jgi:histidinol-phosphate aminotransferase